MVYTLTPSEIEIIKLGKEDPSVITNYFFRSRGREQGFIFDYNFTEGGAWQKQLAQAMQKTICVIGGVGTGKTLGVGLAAVAWCLTTSGFRFLNVAQKAWQAKLMYDEVLRWARNSPVEQLIYKKPQRPYPKIIFRYRIGDDIVESSMEFLSADKNAEGIFSWRGDWINVEEAGLLDQLSEVSSNLSTRLTGTTENGRAFLGRLSFISNPWDNPHLWYLFDMAKSDPESLSLRLSTLNNKNVTESQIATMLKHVPVEDHERFLHGFKAEGKGTYFAKRFVEKSVSSAWGAIIEKKAANNEPGWTIHTQSGAGVTRFTTPPQKGHTYIILGDPGIKNAPHRDSPVIQVWDCTHFDKGYARLAAMHWGGGNGSISKFIDVMLDWREIYDPVFLGADSTATQRNTAEVINDAYGLNDDQYAVMQGLDFSGSKKMGYLVALRLFIETNRLRWPNFVIGMRSQFVNYDPVNDKKMAQDLIACAAMSAHVMRIWFHVSVEEYQKAHAVQSVRNTLRHSALPRNVRRQRGNQRSARTKTVSPGTSDAYPPEATSTSKH